MNTQFPRIHLKSTSSLREFQQAILDKSQNFVGSKVANNVTEGLLGYE
jgi:hypothetical protein